MHTQRNPVVSTCSMYLTKSLRTLQMLSFHSKVSKILNQPQCSQSFFYIYQSTVLFSVGSLASKAAVSSSQNLKQVVAELCGKISLNCNMSAEHSLLPVVWMHNSTSVLPKDGKRSISQSPTGQILHLANTSVEDTGVYTCRLVSPDGWLFSQSFNVTTRQGETLGGFPIFNRTTKKICCSNSLKVSWWFLGLLEFLTLCWPYILESVPDNTFVLSAILHNIARFYHLILPNLISFESWVHKLLKGQCHDIQWFFALFFASKQWRLLA